jgi:lysozyme family protein
VTPLPHDYLPGLPLGFRYGMRFIWDPSRDGNSNDSAPGEAFETRFGITQMTWNSAVRQGIVKGTLRAATQAQLGNIYLANYWQAMSLSALPTAIGFCLFCDSTLTGPGHCASLLQGLVGAGVDGVIGPKTLAAAGAYLSTHGQAALVDAIIAAQLAYLGKLRNAPQFIHGWTSREHDEQALAHEIIASEVPTPTAAIA